MKKNDDELITNQGLRAIRDVQKQEIVEEVSEVISDAMTNIGTEFKKVDKHFDKIELRLDDFELGQGRIERKLNAVVERQDEQGMEINKLKRKVFKAA